MKPCVSAAGLCSACSRVHALPRGAASEHARLLMQALEHHQRLDFPGTDDRDEYSTRPLFGEARGQMFGVMECVDHQGHNHVLKAFSGQFNGCWLIDGWAPPLVDLEAYERIVVPGDRKVKAYGREMETLNPQSARYRELKATRKALSQDLMQQIHAIYRVWNFRGQEKSLPEVFEGGPGIPSGTGDCCAPKLLNWAMDRDLRPVSLAEFYWGRENRSGTRHHGRFYASCDEKCAPILGFMLCGLETA